MTYINRDLEKKIHFLSTQFPVVVLTGARQVGKTTLLKHRFPEYSWVSLDLPSLAEQAENDPEFFLRNHPAPLVVDEVQYAPKLFRFIKKRVDENRHEMGQFILTGSQKFVLMKEISDSLAGRVAILNLEGLSLNELKSESSDTYEDFLSRGFFPEIWRQKDLDLNAFYSSYVATYLERDVRQILNVQSLRDFERFLRACAARSAQLLNMSDLARDVGIKPQTARDWISVLEASNQITLLEPYFGNIPKRLAKSPKLYFNDTGLLAFLLALDPKSIGASPLTGALWETLIFSEFRKTLSIRGNRETVWFYRDAQAKEIDFLLSAQGKVHLIEAKWTENPDQKWISQIEEIEKVLEKNKKVPLGTRTLLCRVSEPFTRGRVKITNPFEFFSALLEQ